MHMSNYNLANVYCLMNGMGCLGRSFWIGLDDIDDEGIFTWSSGQALNYTAWWPDEPNNWQNQDCTILRYIYPRNNYDQFQWDDDDCEAQSKFICEMGEYIWQ